MIYGSGRDGWASEDPAQQTDNLEALFRPVAMMVPNYALIGEITMFSYGYLESQACAQKMVATFSLCA